MGFNGDLMGFNGDFKVIFHGMKPWETMGFHDDFTKKN